MSTIRVAAYYLLLKEKVNKHAPVPTHENNKLQNKKQHVGKNIFFLIVFIHIRGLQIILHNGSTFWEFELLSNLYLRIYFYLF